jgi:hypothetical protein
MSVARASESDREALEAGLPYIRSILAFLVFIRFGHPQQPGVVDEAYQRADEFISQLKKDVGA